MKKVLILLLGVAVISSACGRADKKAAAKQAETERIRMRQDSARRADEERMQELQMKARQDSIAMAMAMSSLSTSSSASSGHRTYSAYYVVVGSFLDKSNASAYLEEMQGIFDDAQIVRSGKWSMVCVGGKFKSFHGAAATLDDVKSQLGGGGSDEEVTEDVEVSDEMAVEESYDEESFEEEGGQAWVMGI